MHGIGRSKEVLFVICAVFFAGLLLPMMGQETEFRWKLRPPKMLKTKQNIKEPPYLAGLLRLRDGASTYSEHSSDPTNKYSTTVAFSWTAPPAILTPGQTFQMTFSGEASGAPAEKCQARKLTFSWRGFAVVTEGDAQPASAMEVGMDANGRFVAEASETISLRVTDDARLFSITVGHGSARATYSYDKLEVAADPAVPVSDSNATVEEEADDASTAETGP